MRFCSAVWSIPSSIKNSISSDYVVHRTNHRGTSFSDQVVERPYSAGVSL